MPARKSAGEAPQQPAAGFIHGVASFDPLPDGIIIWTRVTPASSADSAAVDWQVSKREDFSSLAASGTAVADARHDFTVAVDVGGLRPGCRYHYRFSSGKLHSVTGVTKTAAAGPLEEMIFASVSCANWGFGRFHVYDLLSRVDDLDFVVHCGDYIYEYEKYEYPGKALSSRHGLRPKHACHTLDDYRQRYACYRTDPALQELHRRVPMIAAWDDHEIADSANIKGADNHDGSRKEWEERKRVAIQAYAEWIPVRGLSSEEPDLAGCHRTFHFGDLATLMLIESRIAKRTPLVDVSETEFYRQTALKHPKEWDDDAIKAAKDELLQELADPSRTMIGPEQLQDVAEAVKESVGAGRPWQFLMSQTVLSQIKAPKLAATVRLQPRLLAWVCRKALKTATKESRSGKEGAGMARMYLGMGRYGVPMNPGAWDGFAAERAELLKVLNVKGSNPVVLAGDSHNAWAHELIDSSGHRLGVEFDSPGVTCPGAFEDIYSRFRVKVGRLAACFPLYMFTPWLEDSLKAANPDTLKYCNLDQRGFVLMHVTRAKCHAEFHFVSSVKYKEYKNYCGAVFDAEAGITGRLRRGVRYLTLEGKIPERDQPKRAAFLRSRRAISKHSW